MLKTTQSMTKILTILVIAAFIAAFGGCRPIDIHGAKTIGPDPDDADGPGLFTGKAGGVIIYKNPSEADDGSD